MAVSKLDLVVAGHKGAISMVEAGAKEVSEETMVKALTFAHEQIVHICNEIEVFAKMVAKEKREVATSDIDKKLVEEILKKEAKNIEANLFNSDKAARESAMD